MPPPASRLTAASPGIVKRALPTCHPRTQAAPQRLRNRARLGPARCALRALRLRAPTPTQGLTLGQGAGAGRLQAFPVGGCAECEDCLSALEHDVAAGEVHPPPPPQPSLVQMARKRAAGAWPQDFREQRSSDRAAAPEVAAGTAMALLPGQAYCLLPHSWLEARPALAPRSPPCLRRARAAAGCHVAACAKPARLHPAGMEGVRGAREAHRPCRG